MDILHISRVVETADKGTDVVFIYHSKEVRDRILNDLANAGYKWSSSREINDKRYTPTYMPGGIRPESRSDSYYGSLGYYLKEAPSYKLLRVVL